MRARAIVETRETFGASVPRPAKRVPKRLRPPPWCDASDKLHGAYRNAKRLFLEGQVVWGTLVQANSLLFEPGRDPCPAMVLFGFEPTLDDEVFTLRELAAELFSYKDGRPHDPAARGLQHVLLDELVRGLVRPLAPSLSRGLPLFTTSTMIHREFLPQGFLGGRTFPLLVHRDLPHSFVLPHAYWSDRILFQWGALPGSNSEVI
jgi:hypothetical protein